jgi:hypothetical protein
MVVILLQKLELFLGYMWGSGFASSSALEYKFSLNKVPVFTNSSVTNEPKQLSGTINHAFSIIHPSSGSIKAALGVSVVRETSYVLVSVKKYFTRDVSLLHLPPKYAYFNSKLISLKLTQILVQRTRSIL